MNKEKIVKPSTIRKEEYVQKLVEITNNSSLPLFVVEYILKDFIQEVHMASKQQLQSDVASYKEMISLIQADDKTCDSCEKDDSNVDIK